MRDFVLHNSASTKDFDRIEVITTTGGNKVRILITDKREKSAKIRLNINHTEHTHTHMTTDQGAEEGGGEKCIGESEKKAREKRRRRERRKHKKRQSRLIPMSRVKMRMGRSGVYSLLAATDSGCCQKRLFLTRVFCYFPIVLLLLLLLLLSCKRLSSFLD